MINVHLWVLQVFLWLISSFVFFLACFFLALKNIPLFGSIAVYLSIHLVKNILVVSKFRWWEIKLIQKSMHVLFVDIVFLLCTNWTVCCYLFCCSTYITNFGFSRWLGLGNIYVLTHAFTKKIHFFPIYLLYVCILKDESIQVFCF